MKLLEEVKSHSSKWVKTLDTQLRNFYRQNGYGAFSERITPFQGFVFGVVFSIHRASPCAIDDALSGLFGLGKSV